MAHKKCIAWTGGSPPAPILPCSCRERTYVEAFFAEQCKDFEDYWGEPPIRGEDGTIEIFWNRAWYDAHATMRHLERRVSPALTNFYL